MGFFRDGRPESEHTCTQGCVFKLIQAVTQRDAGQRGKKGHVDWDELWIYQMTICCEATALVLSGELDKLETEGKDNEGI